MDNVIDYIHTSTEEVAQKLLGKLLIHETPSYTYSGYIVETEAYVGVEDMACHGYAGKRTPRLASLYKAGGTIYVYSMHTHDMLNIVTEEEGNPQAVLIRAVQPCQGIAEMEKNRKTSGVLVSNGPGKLTKAMKITKDLDGEQINQGRLLLTEGKIPKEIIITSRIGIPNKQEWTSKPLRYIVKGNPFVSRMRKKDMDAWDGWE